METSAVRRAVEIAGGQRALGQLLGVSQQAVGQWLSNDRIPANRVVQIAQATGIPRHELRPDLYPAEATA